MPRRRFWPIPPKRNCVRILLNSHDCKVRDTWTHQTGIGACEGQPFVVEMRRQFEPAPTLNIGSGKQPQKTSASRQKLGRCSIRVRSEHRVQYLICDADSLAIFVSPHGYSMSPATPLGRVEPERSFIEGMETVSNRSMPDTRLTRVVWQFLLWRSARSVLGFSA